MTEGIHLVMRFSDSIGELKVNTIEAHLEVLHRHGTVWFGKMGRTLSVENIDRLNSQSSKGEPTHVYLLRRKSRQDHSYEIHRGTIASVSRSAPGQKWLAPAYYEQNELSGFMTLWIKLSELVPVDGKILSRLWMVSSGSTVAETIGRTMAAMFVVTESKR